MHCMPVIYCWYSICNLLLLVYTFVFLILCFSMLAIEFLMNKVDHYRYYSGHWPAVERVGRGHSTTAASGSR